MGFSTSGAAAVIFVGILVATTMAFPAVESVYDARSTALEERNQRALDIKNTDIQVAAINETNTLIVNVTNVGSTTLSVNETDLLVDGSFVVVDASSGMIAVDGDVGRSTFGPGETLRIETGESHDTVDRVKVVVENGVADTVTGV